MHKLQQTTLWSMEDYAEILQDWFEFNDGPFWFPKQDVFKTAKAEAKAWLDRSEKIDKYISKHLKKFYDYRGKK